MRRIDLQGGRRNKRLVVRAYRDWQGLNSSNSWWKSHDEATMTNVEKICPDLKLLDIQTNPTIQNTYAQDAGIDGSRFEYNNLAKTTIKLRFWLHWSTYEDYLDKKHDIQAYFAAKARFIIQTSYHPALHAACYTSKVDMNLPEDHADLHDLVFDVELDNALGMWFTNSTDWIEKHWDSYMNSDLRLPSNITIDDLHWNLTSGTNKVYIPGDVMQQMTNPAMSTTITVHGASSGVKIFNKTSNTWLEAHDDKTSKTKVPSSITWYNLNLCDGDDHPINMCSNSLDFWLDPGWNEIVLSNASSAYINTNFYFTNF